MCIYVNKIINKTSLSNNISPINFYYRKFSSQNLLLAPKRGRSETSTEMNEIEAEHPSQRIPEFIDRDYSAEAIYGRIREWNNMSISDAKMARNNLNQDIKNSHNRLCEELREDFMEEIKEIENSNDSDEEKRIRIKDEEKELAEKISQSQGQTGKSLSDLNDAWKLTKHSGSLDDSSSNDSSDDGDNNDGDNNDGGITSVNDENSEVINETSNEGVENFDQNQSTIDFVIELESCLSIYNNLYDDYDVL